MQYLELALVEIAVPIAKCAPAVQVALHPRPLARPPVGIRELTLSVVLSVDEFSLPAACKASRGTGSQPLQRSRGEFARKIEPPTSYLLPDFSQNLTP